MFNSILVVCTGNICRSPIGERLLRESLPGRKIDSAGLSAVVNKPADLAAMKVAEKNGLSLEGHLGRQFNSEMGRRYQLILVMEHVQIELISKNAPEFRGKTMLMGHWLNGKEIPDPYRKSDEAFDSVYQLLDRSCKLWTEKLSR